MSEAPGTSEVVPPWADGPIPDTALYVESELFVAGAMSTLPPFNHYHPAWALPLARQALHALGEWEPVMMPRNLDNKRMGGTVECPDCRGSGEQMGWGPELPTFWPCDTCKGRGWASPAGPKENSES